MHPGTLDVDLLFRQGDSAGALFKAIDALRMHGFTASAKHSFQLLLYKTVGSEKLIYNIDLLHPQMCEDSMGMFVDHLELDVPIDDHERTLKQVCSIVQPNSRVIFDQNLFSNYTLQDTSFPLVDFTGMFLTKMDSCQKQKRERDSFDIVIAFENSGIDFEKLKRLRDSNERIQKSLDKFRTYLGDHGEMFDANVAQYHQFSYSPAAKVRNDLESEL